MSYLMQYLQWGYRQDWFYSDFNGKVCQEDVDISGVLEFAKKTLLHAAVSEPTWKSKEVKDLRKPLFKASEGCYEANGIRGAALSHCRGAIPASHRRTRPDHGSRAVRRCEGRLQQGLVHGGTGRCQHRQRGAWRIRRGPLKGAKKGSRKGVGHRAPVWCCASGGPSATFSP